MDLDAVATQFGVVVKAAFPTFKIADNPLDSVLPPTFFVADFTSEPHKTFSGFTTATFTLRLLVGKADPQSGGKLLRGYAGDGTGTVYAALEAPHASGLTQTLNGTCSDIVCDLIRGYRGFIHDRQTYIGVEWVFTVVGEKAA